MMMVSRSTLLFAVVALAGCGSVVPGSDGGTGGGFAGGTGGSAGGGTGGGAQAVAPKVTSTFPSSNATNVATNAHVTATFSGAMDGATLTSSSFTVKQGSTEIAGAVTYVGTTATFIPTAAFAAGTSLTATLSTAVKSEAGLALAAAYTWTFSVGATASLGPAPVGLGAAGNYAVLAKTAISSVPPSAVTGDVAVSPAAASFITGFSLVNDATNVFATSPQVTGKIYAADSAVPTPINLTTAIGNMESAYVDAESRITPDHLELGGGAIGGLTLAPGLYKWTSSIGIASNVTVSGGPNDVWIFQTSGDLTIASATSVTLAGGALAKNIFWQVAGQATLSATSHFEGVILSKTAITLQTGATLNGRALAQTQVALQQATVVGN